MRYSVFFSFKCKSAHFFVIMIFKENTTTWGGLEQLTPAHVGYFLSCISHEAQKEADQTDQYLTM